jgi:dTDP-4-amino-4,6-dideoxygalactose transaminase
LFDLYGGLTAYRLPAAYWADLPARLLAVPADRTRRLDMAAHYDQRLSGLPVRTLPRPDGSTLWRYPLLVPAHLRADLLHHLWENGVHEATRWYPSLQPMAAALTPSLRQPPTPNADHVAAQIVNLPLNVDTSATDRIAGYVHDAFRNASKSSINGSNDSC